MQEADFDIIGVMDADLQHPPEVLPELLEAINDGSDLAVASRFVESWSIPNFSFSRKVFSFMCDAFARFFLKETREYTDILSGFYVFKRSIVTDDIRHLGGFKFLLVILVEGTYTDVTEVKYEIRKRRRNQSKVSLSSGAVFFLNVIKLWLRNKLT
jgi:dolichol-phosphate mannosyltransferase